MRIKLIVAVVATLLSVAPAHAIDAKYRQQLERSGCTQASELQGCDIRKTRAENAKAGFVTQAPAGKTGQSTPPNPSPYAGQWVAVGTSGSTVAEIAIDAKERVKVNGKRVKAKRSDGGLAFRQGTISYFIQGDRQLKGEDYWSDADAKTKGPINAR